MQSARMVKGIVVVGLMLAISGCSKLDQFFFGKPAEEKIIKVEKKPVEKKPAKKKELSEDEDLNIVSTPVVAETTTIVKEELSAPPSEVKAETNESAKTEAKPSVELPKDPNTFLVQAGVKDVNHPSFGTGDKRGFIVNGQQGKPLVLVRGQEYTFQVRTGVQHDFYISTNPMGWGAAAFLDGVKGQFTYNGDVSFIPTKEAPGELYYQCRNHKAMGGKLLLVNDEVEQKSVLQQVAKAVETGLAQRQQLSAEKNLDPAKVKQKVSYAGMLIQFKSKDLDAATATELNTKFSHANTAYNTNDFATALKLATEVADFFNAKKAQEPVGPSEEEIAEQKAEYEELIASINSFRDSHIIVHKQAELNDKGPKPQDYDKKKVKQLEKEADEFAKREDYKQAISTLRKAEREITLALNAMLNQQTLVYELKFDTPKDEFEYEVKRYKSYEELIPVALEVKKPKPGSIKLMEMFKKKATFFAEKAQESADKDNYPEALVIIKNATKEIRRGLMSLEMMM